MSTALPILTVPPDGLGDYHNAPLCVGCGACCMSLGWPPFDGLDDLGGCEPEKDVELQMLPGELRAELMAEVDALKSSEFCGACCWLDMETKRCRHYAHRPVACSRFEPGCDICLEDRQAQGIDA